MRDVTGGATSAMRGIIRLGLERGWARGTALAMAAVRIAREGGETLGARLVRRVVRCRRGMWGVLKEARASVTGKWQEIGVVIGADYPIGNAEGDRDGARGKDVDCMVETRAALQEPETGGLE